jgi:hypothetical protein
MTEETRRPSHADLMDAARNEPPPFGDTGVSEVLVLGAGFSIAVCGAMPDTDTLGSQAIERAGLTDRRLMQAGGFRHGTFESWLSRLAEDQPHLSDAENQQNRADYLALA